MDTVSIVIGSIVVVVVLGAALLVLSRRWGNVSTSATLLPPPDPPRVALDDAELRALLGQGNKLAAIKRVRELTGVGLKQAKDYVEGLPISLAQPIQPPTLSASPALASDPELRALLAQGNKLAAIKRVRELTGMGLKQAKDYVDTL